MPLEDADSSSQPPLTQWSILFQRPLRSTYSCLGLIERRGNNWVEEGGLRVLGDITQELLNLAHFEGRDLLNIAQIFDEKFRPPVEVRGKLLNPATATRQRGTCAYTACCPL